MGLYRNTDLKRITIAFRGTCAPLDLITDANLLQTPWVEGEDKEAQGVLMVRARVAE